uniref:phage tail protein n=1 Tax=Clostridium sp. 12(A) TaxID=1163671 RepID=UPI0004661780|nr:phage tail protein [Clostridium sp. 12(A)]
MEKTIVDPVEYVNSDKGIEDAPVGHILSYMGTTPPSHYLTCDGAIYNITDYPFLAQHIKIEFGSFNYFGGDGTSTFAVPDLRNEFLRGYHASKTEKLSGEIGIHQNPTENIFLYTGNSKVAFTSNYNSADQFPSNMDSIIQGTNNTGWLVNSSAQNWSSTGIGKYTARPTNIAVLYCIKYEPTYFMSIQGLIEDTILWEGLVGTNGTTQVSRSISLTTSVLEYDEIGFYYQASIGTAVRLDYNSFPSKRFKDLIESLQPDTHLTLNWGQSPHISFADIEKTSSYSNLNFLMYQSYVTKITGIKYKTFQN